MAAVEINRRKPVWSALSNFYLDTKFGKDKIKRIAEVFIDSKYTIEELKEINYSEVGPIVYTNLYSTAGIWNGFNEEWLYEQITKRLDKKNGIVANILRPIFRKQIDKACSEYWQTIIIEMKNHVV